MRKYFALAVLALAAVPATAASQEMMQHEHNVGMASITPLYEQFKGWIVASAEQMAEENYGYKPTPEVRSFGQMIGHVANAAYMFCAGALGEESPNKQNFEQISAKAELVSALRGAFAYCDKAYAMPESKAMEQTKFFGRDGSRLWVLIFNVTHNAEHYGNLVTYMRLKGMVPPSSQRGGM